jgi:hypothetical protein
VLLSAGISQRSGYPGISPIFSEVVSPDLGYPGISPKIFGSKRIFQTCFSVLRISQDILTSNWDIPGYVDLGIFGFFRDILRKYTLFWDILFFEWDLPGG